MNANYTPIDDLIKKNTELSGYGGSYAKETEPIVKKREAVGNALERSSLNEVVEHISGEELTPFIKVRSETIELPPDLKKMGLKPATTTSFPSYQSVTLPLADDKVYAGLQAPVNSSVRWFAELCLFLLKRAHLTLVNIHGKVVRVIKTKV